MLPPERRCSLSMLVSSFSVVDEDAPVGCVDSFDERVIDITFILHIGNIATFSE